MRFVSSKRLSAELGMFAGTLTGPGFDVSGTPAPAPVPEAAGLLAAAGLAVRRGRPSRDSGVSEAPQRVSVRGVAIAVGLLLFGTVPSSADPVTITGGSVQVAVGISSARITLSGDGFLVRTSTEDFSTPLAMWPFPAGTSVSLGGVWHPTDLRGGEAIYNGVHYPVAYFGYGESGGTFIAPSVTPTGEGYQEVTMPFTFTGFVTAFASQNPGPDEDPLFTATLTGSGMARTAFFGLPPEGGFPALYSPTTIEGTDYNLEYVFATSSSAPVPEPGSLALLATTAVAAVSARMRSRRRRR